MRLSIKLPLASLTSLRGIPDDLDEGVPTLTALDISAASRSTAAVYSLRKVIPTYAGNCLQVRDSGGTVRTLGFKGDNTYDAPTATWAAYGDGVTFTVSTWYDQSGNARPVTSSLRPRLVFPNAPTNYDGAYIDFGLSATNAKNDNLASAATFLNVGGTNNLTVLAVTGASGFTSATSPMPRPGTYSSGVQAPLLGYGTLAAGVLVHSVYGANAETTMYGKEGVLYTDATTTFTSGRIRAHWWNQQGATVSGGSSGTVAFSARPHGVSEALAQRLVIGNNGAANQAHNGRVYEIVIFNSGAITDLEARRLSLGQAQAWTSVVTTARVPRRYRFIGAGQSTMQYYGTVASASTGLVADYADVRVFKPALKTLLGGDTDTLVETYQTFNTTAIGGSAVITATSLIPDGPGGTSWLAWDGVTTAKKFWWDQFADIPGPVAMLWLSAVSAMAGVAYQNVVLGWAQGEAEATAISISGETGGLTYANYKAALGGKLWPWMRTQIGQTCPILIQPLGRQSGTDAQCKAIRAIQTQLAAELSKVYLCGETTHFTRQDAVHFAAGPADPDGFDRGAKQIARGAADLMLSGGAGTIAKWRGPAPVSAVLSGSTTIDVTVSWPAQGGGSDIAAIDGGTTGFVGFEVTDGSGARTVSGAARQSANTIRVTVSGGALSGTVTVTHNPAPAGLDRTKMVVDNSVGLPLALQPATLVAA